MDSITCRIILVTALTKLLAICCFVQGVPRFSREPPSVLYASCGGIARLVWDYNVKNRTEVFDPFSPEWYFYNKSGSELRIGVDNGFKKWKFVINEECPTRLRGRVSRESTATLVISNVTTADSGIYGCDLILLSGTPIKSKVHLIVTERPHLIAPVNSKTYIMEGSPLHVLCSASANPVPNVTWVRIMETPIFFNTGVGRVFLIFSNITRHQSGSYECQAANNPNEDPVTTKTEILVNFPVTPVNVSVSNVKVTSTVIKWLGPYEDGGSAIIEYKIRINTIPPREIITRATFYVIKKLRENTSYSVEVSARNSVGYGKATPTVFTTKTHVISVVSTVPSQKTTPYALSKTYFYQERTFAIIHLNTTCVLLLAITILVLYLIFKKRNMLKDNQEESTRFPGPVLFRSENEDNIVVTTNEISSNNDVAENASHILPKVYEDIPEHSGSLFDTESSAQGGRQVQQAQTPHYQELRNDAYKANVQDYQSLRKFEEASVTAKQSSLPLRKYETLDFKNQPHPKYQKLHLYASIGDKK